jgi:hypothetical protein
MPSLPPARSCRILSSASASGLLPKPCAFSFCVSSPIAKYASCSRAQASQKGIPQISTAARRRHGLSVLFRTWQGPGVLVGWVKRTFLLRARDLLLVIRTPLVSAPATNRVRTLRQDISSLETPIAAVGQAYDGRPVRPRCRLLRFLLGGVGLGLHLYSLPLGCGCLIKARLPPSLVFCIIYYNYTTRRVRGVAMLRLRLRVVTYPPEYKRIRAAFPRLALGGAHTTFGSYESLAMGHRLPRSLHSQRRRG